MNKQDILDKLDIVDVVSEYVELERKGKNYFGVCPFHDDNNPSMSVSPQRQMYKCFSCGAGGDAINFVKEIENISFQESLAKLASSVGVEYTYQNETSVIKDEYYNIYHDSTKYFVYNLQHSKDGEKYLEYLKQRKFSLETLEEFNIGCANNDLTDLLESKYKHDDIVKTGIINNNDNLIFKARIIFPIADINGNVIGFSGRVINDATPKYLNTPETKYFKKSEILYNMHQAKPEISKLNSVVITEGFFDVMRLHSNGIKNVIATMGTAFTASHVKLINSYASNIYLCMDSDEAGRKASAAMYKMLKSSDAKVYMVSLDEEDPDDFIVKYGIDKFKTRLYTAKLYEEYYVDMIIGNYLDMSVSQKEQAIEQVKSFANSIDSEITRQLINEYVVSKTGINVISYKTYTKPKTVAKSVDGSVVESYYKLTVEEEDVINKIEKEFLYLMTKTKLAIEAYENEVYSLNLPQNDEVAMLIKQFYIQNEFSNIIDYFNNSYQDYNELQREIILDILKEITSFSLSSDEFMVDDYVKRVIVFKYEKRISDFNKKILLADSDAKKIELLKKLNVLIKEKTDIIERRGM